MEYVILEGGEGNPFEEQALRPPPALTGDEYVGLLAGLAERIGDNAIVSAGTRYGPKLTNVHINILPGRRDFSLFFCLEFILLNTYVVIRERSLSHNHVCIVKCPCHEKGPYG